MKKLSVVFTFYNEHHCIESAVNEVSSVLNQYNEIEHELIFVNDCSNDNSLKVLLDLREKNKKIKIVNMSRRFGLFPCIMAGFRHTTGDAAIYLDVDLQDPPEIIHEMIKYWLKDNYDVVYTTRKKTSGNNFFLKMLSKVGYLILSKTSNIKVDVNTGDFKLITRKVINEYIKFNEIDPFHRLIIDYIGFKKKQIFYNRRQRIKGKSNFNLYDIIIKSFFEKTFAPFSDFPLRFALIFGFFSFVVCMFVLFRTLFLYLGGLSSQEISTTSIFVAILFVSPLDTNSSLAAYDTLIGTPLICLVNSLGSVFRAALI